MMNAATEIDTADVLAARAQRLLRTDRYLPGRAHFAAALGECLYHEVVTLLMRPRHTANGRATLANLAWRLFLAADDEVRAEGARMLGASIMNTHFDGGSL